MPKILLQNLHNKEIFTLNDSDSILNTIQSNYIDWMHACGAKGRCTTCKIIVIEGMENISDYADSEHKFLKNGKLRSNERLACQCSISGDVVVRVAEENKFPHMVYSS